MKYIIFYLLILTSVLTYGQKRFLTVASKDSIEGKPKYKSSLGVNMKLNAYYDVFGGLGESETFNVGQINVFGDNDESTFHVDMYQTQIKWQTDFVLKNGREIMAVVEFDFWGGNGHMRLRKAYLESENWQIGQNWNNFGDEYLWPNIMEWEGPPSGIWMRSPHIKYTNKFNNEHWIYEVSLEAPISDYDTFSEFEVLVEETTQVTPDVTFAIKNKQDWGHIRLSSILRSVRYSYDDEIDNFLGYGLSLSGIYKHDKNSFQYQFVGGKGITAYLTSVGGLGYDGFPTSKNEMEATPAIGGWLSYEYFFTPKLHSNFVVGYTDFSFDDLQRYIVPSEEIEAIYLNGNVDHKHYYGIANIMYDIFEERMIVGLELDYGAKKLVSDGYLNDHYLNRTDSRNAMRISFGFMFFF